MRKIKKVFFITASILVLVPFIAMSQTKNDAISAYNEGAQLIKSDPAGAMAAFKKCIEICEAVGEEATDTRVMAETKLPGLQYKLAMESYKQKKMAEAIEKFEEAEDLATKYKNDKILEKTKKVIPQLYMVVGNSQMKQDLQEALKNLNKATELDPNLTKAYLSKGLIYKKLGDEENMKAALTKTIELGFARNAIKTATQAEKVLKNYYFNKAVKAVKEGNMDEAEASFKSSVEYGSENPIVYTQLGKIYNSKKEYDLALKNLTRALEFEQGGDEKKAGIYYEIGNAYMGLGNNTEACNSFKKAMFGDYTESAKYQIEEVLKCN